MDLSQISILAIILAVVANMIIGALWYSPVLFANVWMKSLGKTRRRTAYKQPEYRIRTYDTCRHYHSNHFIISHFDVGLSYSWWGSINWIFSGCWYCKRAGIIAYLF